MNPLKCHLNHWKKSIAFQQFKYKDVSVNNAWQIVPAVLSTYTPSQMHERYDYRQNGYWHITHSQVMASNEFRRPTLPGCYQRRDLT